MITEMASVSTKDQFYKTKLCPHHQSTGCRNKGECFFAHGMQELRVAPDLRKTRLCKEFMKSGTCEQGEACIYAHGEKELRGTDGYWKTDLCKYWKSGGCTAGHYCRHAHGLEELHPKKYKQGSTKNDDGRSGSLSMRHSNKPKMKNLSGYLTPQARPTYGKAGGPIGSRFVMTPMNQTSAKQSKGFHLKEESVPEEEEEQCVSPQVVSAEVAGPPKPPFPRKQAPPLPLPLPQQAARSNHQKILFVCKEDDDDDDECFGHILRNPEPSCCPPAPPPPPPASSVPAAPTSRTGGEDFGSAHTLLEDALDELLDCSNYDDDNKRLHVPLCHGSATDVGSMCTNLPTDNACCPTSTPSPLPSQPYMSLSQLPLSKRPSLSVPSPSITSFSKKSKVPFIPPPPKTVPPPMPRSIPPPPPPSPNSLVPPPPPRKGSLFPPTPPPPPSKNSPCVQKCSGDFSLSRTSSSTVCTSVPSRSASIASSRGPLSPPPPPPLRVTTSPALTRSSSLAGSPPPNPLALQAPLSPPAPPPLSPPMSQQISDTVTTPQPSTGAVAGTGPAPMLIPAPIAASHQMMHLETGSAGMYYSYVPIGSDPKGNVVYVPMMLWQARESGVPMDLQAKFNAVSCQDLTLASQTVAYAD